MGINNQYQLIIHLQYSSENREISNDLIEKKPKQKLKTSYIVVNYNNYMNLFLIYIVFIIINIYIYKYLDWTFSIE